MSDTTQPDISPEKLAQLAHRRALGRTGLEVTSVCIGGGPLGGMKEVFGYDTPMQQAVDTVLTALESPFKFLDTAAGYTNGESERRFGAAFAQVGGVPSDTVLATKVDPDPETGEYTGAAVRRSIEGSLERLGVTKVPLLHLHDPEQISFEQAMATDGPVAELLRIRDEGLADHLGVAGGHSALLGQFLDTGEFEVVLTHNRYTLADTTASWLIDKAVDMGVGVINAAPFGGGVLARGTAAVDKYCYQPMSAQTRAGIVAIEQICADAGVPLGAAALQFSTRDPRIASTIVGVSKPERIAQAAQWASWDIADDIWSAILDAAGTDAGLPN